MLFENPWLLLGLAAAAIPVAIHLINRRKAPVRHFAAIDFILLSNKRLLRRMKLKHWLVLLLRVLLIAAIPFALARPYWVPKDALAALDESPMSMVIVIDDSLSTAYRVDGKTLFDRARERATELVRRLGSESSVGVVMASTPARALAPELTFDRESVLDQLSSLEPTERTTDAAGALRLAEAMLASSTLPERRIVVLTDLQRTSWSALARPWSLDTPPPVDLVDVTPKDTVLVNASITSVQVERAIDVSPRHIRVKVEVAAFGAAPFDDVVTVRVAGRALKNSLRVEPGERATTTFLMKLDSKSVESGEATIPSDALPMDDRRVFTVDFLHTVPVLVVNGAPRSIPYRDEVFFLEKALETGGEAETRIQPLFMRADEVTPQQLERVDVVVLANVLELRSDVVPAIRSFVEGGGGLLITAGDNVTPAYNAQFGDLLPMPVRAVKTVVKRSDKDAQVRALSVDKVDFGHPVLRLFRNLADSSLFSARFYSYLLLDGAVPGSVHVLASYSNGAPLLVEKRVGSGRVIMLTTTVDRDWSDLAIRTSFLPLVQQLCMHLADRLEHTVQSSIAVGEPYVIDTEPGLARVVVETPDDRTVEYDDPLRDGRGPVRFEDTGQSGVYRVDRVLAGDREPAVERFAVNPDPRESDVGRESPAEIIAALEPGTGGPDGAPITTLASSSPWRTNLWPYVLVALFFLLISEAALVARS